MSDSKSAKKNIIYTSNQEMLTYFNDMFLHDLEEIQELKTELFEIEVRIEEIQKTRNLYSFKNSSRRNAFSPITPESTVDEDTIIMYNQINSLEDRRDNLERELKRLEKNLNNTKKTLTMLQDAKNAITNLGITGVEDLHSSITDEDEDGFEFIEGGNAKKNLNHNYNLLMLDAFNNSFISSLLSKSVVDNLASINHKLETVPGLISSDVNRAKLTIDDIRKNNADVAASVKDLVRRIDFPLDSNKPIWAIVDEFIMMNRDVHPTVVIESSVECPNYDLKLHPLFAINLLKLLNIFFDNIYKHANASKIDVKFSITPNVIDVTITDNGIGIKDDYMEKAPWYSGLHKANEILYLLNGTYSINGDLNRGTTVKFSFSVKR